jgi:hypothetical protein
MSSSQNAAPDSGPDKRTKARMSLGSLLGFRTGFSLRASSRAAGRFLRTQVWAWPICAAALLAAIAYWINSAVERTVRQQIAGEVKTICDAGATAARIWMKEQEVNARMAAVSEGVLPRVRRLLEREKQATHRDTELMQAKEQAELAAYLAPLLKILGYEYFYVVSPTWHVVATNNEAMVGKPVNSARKWFYEKVYREGPSMLLPYRSSERLPDANGDLRSGLPSMIVAAPIPGEDGKPIAVLGLRIRPEGAFTAIFQVGRSGKTGETYALDRTGRMLTQSRFDDDLKQIGLLADLPDSASVLTIELRDPGVNMAEGKRPPQKRADQPLTRSAADAIAGNSGVDVSGYRDYRGVPVVGAWTWVPEYEFGVVTEIATAEAYRPLYILRWTFWGLFGLLALSALAIFLFTVVVARKQREVQKAVLAARQLGQYTLGEKIGAGGMGTVYKASHLMLRRPTAVKLLNPDKCSDEAVERFGREVQLTSQLNHPNTITVYDYGRTPEGVFYYAMEFLDGINLEDLVANSGALPEGRVVSILRQICGSLAEAHAAGLIHRDIKPSNVILNHRGGLADFVKVLDFGLAKAVGDAQAARLTAANSLTGTPLYLAPEAIERPGSVDARVDIYAIGAVGYFLLTGTPVFRGESIVEICMQHVQTPPETPSRRLGRSVAPALEAVLLHCLEKARERRPAGARILLEELAACDAQAGWSPADAEVWWADFRRGSAASAPASTAGAAAATTAPQPTIGTATVALAPDQRVAPAP